MKMTQRKKNALTLIEVMVVVLIIAVAAIGAMGFRFYCVKDAKLADVQVNAARIGSMILENWKGMGGSSAYDPTSQFPSGTYGSQFTITGKSGNYQIQDQANKVYYDAALLFTSGTLPVPNKLNISLSWRKGYVATGTTVHTISMTTYAD
jgi:prepilin-type N-terminal cleavage/methylation domain-containing protein